MNGVDHGGRIFAIARQLGVAPEALTDFSASINPLGPPPGVRAAVAKAFHRLVHYPDSDCTELAAALARHHGCAPDNVCVGNGSTELLHLIPRLVAGGRALLIAPTFAEYRHALNRGGWHSDSLVLSGGTGFPLDLVRVGDALAAGYDLLFLCNPGNPTGRLYPPEEVAALLALCRERGTVLVVDEAFMDFCEAGSAKAAVIASGAGVVVRSMTKFFGFPGLRLGYALAERSLVARLAALRPPWSVGTLAQEAGLAALADAGYAARTLSYVAKERAFLAAELAALQGMRVFPGAANYLLVELPEGNTAAAVQERLLPEGILIRECGGFTGLGERFSRVAVRKRQENRHLVAALRRVLAET